MDTRITAEFSSVEAAESAANRLRSTVSGIGKITIVSRTAKKDTDTPFMLPYAPQNGLDPWIMLPANYGYPTTNGYLEKISDVSCTVTVDTRGKSDSVRAVLHNCGAESIKNIH